jgi:hypothetical protein
MATRDRAGNTSAWHTVFILRYDNKAPTGNMTLNYGWGLAHGVGVPLDLTASDNGSGVHEVRLGSTCATLGDWQAFQQRLWWQLDGQHGDTASVCAQYRDRAGNESARIEQSVLLDFYPALPSSARYQIAREIQASNGSIGATSERYQMHSTGGQTVASSSPMSSPNYQATLGFWTLRDEGHGTPPATPTPTVPSQPNAPTLTSDYTVGSPGSTFPRDAQHLPYLPRVDIHTSAPPPPHMPYTLIIYTYRCAGASVSMRIRRLLCLVCLLPVSPFVTYSMPGRAARLASSRRCLPILVSRRT